MYYTTIKLENDILLFLRCKNKWSYGGHSRFANFQSIDLNPF